MISSGAGSSGSVELTPQARLRVVSFNVNGIRAAVRRGYLDWLRATDPDVVCLQEVRAPLAAIPDQAWSGYHLSYTEGDRPGRNGVAVLSRMPPSAVRVGFGPRDRFVAEGRYIEVDLPGLTVASLYLPKGDVYGPKFERKMTFLGLLGAQLGVAAGRASRGGRQFLVCGDFNIAPAEADIRLWRANRKSEGFLPPERAWINGPATSHLVDVLRRLHPGEVGPFTWWSWLGQAFELDRGWRIDHQLATPQLGHSAQRAWVDRESSRAARISDHAPVVVDYRRADR